MNLAQSRPAGAGSCPPRAS